MVHVTTAAAHKAVALAEKYQKPARLRLGVKGGGCAGYTFHFDFDEQERQGDVSFTVEALTVVVDAKSMPLLDGCTFDFESNLLKGGFKFRHPSAKRSCSCGESFSF